MARAVPASQDCRVWGKARTPVSTDNILPTPLRFLLAPLAHSNERLSFEDHDEHCLSYRESEQWLLKIFENDTVPDGQREAEGFGASLPQVIPKGLKCCQHIPHTPPQTSPLIAVPQPCSRKSHTTPPPQRRTETPPSELAPVSSAPLWCSRP